MTYQELSELLNGTGIPFAFHHWEKPPVPPYGVYFDDRTANFSADNIAYAVIKSFQIELYLSQRDEALEGGLEAALTAAGLYWDKNTAYVESLRQYKTSYEIEV